jgi:hypothetical protein
MHVPPKRSNPSTMKTVWFKAWGWVYRPVSWPGVLMLALLLIFCVQAFVAVDRHSHSASDRLYGVFPYWAPGFLIYLWIGGKTS